MSSKNGRDRQRREYSSPSFPASLPDNVILQAVKTIEQGHVRVGPTPVTDPALLVTRNMEDFVTWVDTSSRKRTVMRYNDEVSGGCGADDGGRICANTRYVKIAQLDDFDLL